MIRYGVETVAGTRYRYHTKQVFLILMGELYEKRIMPLNTQRKVREVGAKKNIFGKYLYRIYLSLFSASSCHCRLLWEHFIR